MLKFHPTTNVMIYSRGKWHKVEYVRCYIADPEGAMHSSWEMGKTSRKKCFIRPLKNSRICHVDVSSRNIFSLKGALGTKALFGENIEVFKVSN